MWKFSLALLVLVGCRDYDTPEFIEIGNSHTVILSPADGDITQQTTMQSEEMMKKNLVAKKRVQIPHEWRQTGRFYWSGEWVRTLIPTIVDRSPETRKWTPDTTTGTSNNNEGLWAESSDSVGFSTGIECTARIPDHDMAIKFLFNYPSLNEGNSTNLDKIMDNEIRTQIQARFSDFSNFFTMDNLRSRKTDMLTYIKYGILPEDIKPADWVQEPGVIDFFKERGIEITVIGQFGGFKYENPSIQKSIDAVFEAQQDEEVAKAETIAQKERNESIKLKAEGLAESVRLAANGEADAIQTVADAKAYEIEKAQENWEQYILLKQLELDSERLQKWDGKYPQTLFGEMDGMGTTLMINPKVD